ncbi:MAG: phage major capsid protein [Bacteroidales bacterium]|nr:phage major capsid protein [Bacteroidales bacterium]MBR7051606.1 phage major capsid protein [Bacteroidaceae bacterium]
MEKKKFDWAKAQARSSEIGARLNELAEKLENDKEREDFTDEEKAEQRALLREQAILDAKMQANRVIIEIASREDVPDANAQIREAVKNGQRFEVVLKRTWGVDAGFNGNASGYANPASSTNPAPVTIGDVVDALYPNNILSAVGAPLLTGLKGNYMWPVVEAFHATINDEGAALGDTQIPTNKLIAKPERIGIAVPITREALTETDDLLRIIATQYIPVAMAELMNKIMFSKTAVSGATNLVGPFITGNITSGHALTYSGDTPTAADLAKVKGVVLKKNIRGEQLCYVMNEYTKAVLEGTPKWSGAADALIVNDKINGVPVFTTSEIPDDAIYFGAFKYAPQGLFGDISFIIDPYTLARKNAIDFVLNVDYAITVLRQQAFATLTKAGSSSD